MEILETKGRKMNKIKREEREDLHTFSDTTYKNISECYNRTTLFVCINSGTLKAKKFVVICFVTLFLYEELYL